MSEQIKRGDLVLFDGYHAIVEFVAGKEGGLLEAALFLSNGTRTVAPLDQVAIADTKGPAVANFLELLRTPEQVTEGGTFIQINSIVSAQTGEPRVDLAITGNPHVVLDTDDARDQAMILIHAAEAAEQDAFMVQFLTGNLKLEMPAAHAMLMDLRRHRTARLPEGRFAAAVAARQAYVSDAQRRIDAEERKKIQREWGKP